MASIFFSYSHVDEDLRDQLATHLSALQRQGVVESWHDRRITAGSNIGSEIDRHLLEADVVLLLISPNFIASDYCYQQEMNAALKRAEAGEAVVIPVILRPCDWKELPFGKFLATPKDGKAITKWANLDEAFLDVVLSIKTALRTHITTSHPQTSTKNISSPGNREIGVVTERPRSSNLQVRKRFTDYDLDAFRNDGFDYVLRYFEGSLIELVDREPALQKKFRKIDAQSFTAAIYSDGEKVCQCTIRIADTLVATVSSTACPTIPVVGA